MCLQQLFPSRYPAVQPGALACSPRPSCPPRVTRCIFIKEDEDYLASKRYISEKFFNMRISHPDMPGLHRSAGSMWQGSADKAAGVGGEIGKQIAGGIQPRRTHTTVLVSRTPGAGHAPPCKTSPLVCRLVRAPFRLPGHGTAELCSRRASGQLCADCFLLNDNNNPVVYV